MGKGNDARGGLSKREWALQQGNTAGSSGSYTTKTSGGYNGFGNGPLVNMANNITGATNQYLNFQAQVDRLPFDLKDYFRKNRSKELDEKINKAETDYGNAGFEGLSKYANVTDPIARRALAEQYQGLRGNDYKNLLSEKDRRQGKYMDYIEKYTGLYSAEASRQQGLLKNMRDNWSMMNTLSQQQNDEKWKQMEWDNKISQQNKSGSKKPLTEAEMRKEQARLKDLGLNWHQINEKMIRDHGVDIQQGGTYDTSMHLVQGTGYTPQKITMPEGMSHSEQLAQDKYKGEQMDENVVIADLMNNKGMSLSEALQYIQLNK